MFLFLRPLQVSWETGEPITRARVQDVRIQRNQDSYLRGTGEVVTVPLPSGNLMLVERMETVDTGTLELDARVRFAETRHEVDVKGLLPIGGVIPVSLMAASDGTWLPAVAVTDTGAAGLNGVLLPVLPRRWEVADVRPFLTSLTPPERWARAARSWARAVRSAESQGHHDDFAAERVELLEAAASGRLLDRDAFTVAERSLLRQLAEGGTEVDRLGLMRLYLQTDRPGEAWAVIEPALGALSSNLALSLELAQAAWVAGEAASAWELLRTVLDAESDDNLVALALCRKLLDAEVGAECPNLPDRPARRERVDLSRESAVDEELASFRREARADADRVVSKVLLDGTIDHPLVDRVRVTKQAAQGEDIELVFDVWLREGFEADEVVVHINPRWSPWYPVQADPTEGYWSAWIPTRQESHENIYWYLSVQEGAKRYVIGSPAEAMTLEP